MARNVAPTSCVVSSSAPKTTSARSDAAGRAKWRKIRSCRPTATASISDETARPFTPFPAESFGVAPSLASIRGMAERAAVQRDLDEIRARLDWVRDYL